MDDVAVVRMRAVRVAALINRRAGIVRGVTLVVAAAVV